MFDYEVSQIIKEIAFTTDFGGIKSLYLRDRLDSVTGISIDEDALPENVSVLVVVFKTLPHLMMVKMVKDEDGNTLFNLQNLYNDDVSSIVKTAKSIVEIFADNPDIASI